MHGMHKHQKNLATRSVHEAFLPLLVSSADNFCKQFAPRSGPTFFPAWSGSKIFDTSHITERIFFKKIDFEKNQQAKKKPGKNSQGAKG